MNPTKWGRAASLLFSIAYAAMNIHQRLIHQLHIPANVTADSGNVTGIPVNVTEGSVLRVLILCRLAFPAGFLSLYWVFYQFIGPCQAAGGAPPRSCRLS